MDDIKFDKNACITIQPAKNGFIVKQSKCPTDSLSGIPSCQYVFNDINDLYKFIGKHFNEPVNRRTLL